MSTKLLRTILPALAGLTISSATAAAEKHNPIEDKDLQQELIHYGYVPVMNDRYFIQNPEDSHKPEWEALKRKMKEHPDRVLVRLNPNCTLSFGVDGIGQCIEGCSEQTYTLDERLDDSEAFTNYYPISSPGKGNEFSPDAMGLNPYSGLGERVQKLCKDFEKEKPVPESKSTPKPASREVVKTVRVTPKEEYKAILTLDGRAMVSAQQEPAAIPCAGLTGLAAFGNDVLVKDGKALLGLSLTGCRSQLSESYEEARMSVPGKTDVLRTDDKKFTTGYYLNPEVNGGVLVPLSRDISLGLLLYAGPQFFMQFQENSRTQGVYDAQGNPVDSAPGAIQPYTKTQGYNLDITFGPKGFITYKNFVAGLGGGYAIPVVRAGEGADTSQGYGQITLSLGIAPKGKK